MTGRIRIGTAGWTIPRAVAGDFPAEGSGLERYAARFDAAEINSTFYRPHRPATFERWAAAVPEGFRFSVKCPKRITHELKFAGCEEALAAFGAEITNLGDRLGPVLVQLPPSLAFDEVVAASFFEAAAARLQSPIACELRHPSWLGEAADALLSRLQVSRVAADPARVPEAATPGGWRGLAYFRLHGSPVMYRSSYDEDALRLWAGRIRAASDEADETWAIFDNTASGAAAANALRLNRLIGG